MEAAPTRSEGEGEGSAREHSAHETSEAILSLPEYQERNSSEADGNGNGNGEVEMFILKFMLTTMLQTKRFDFSKGRTDSRSEG